MTAAPAADPSLGAAADVTARLGTDTERGLTATEAARRLAADGPNSLRGTPPGPPWRRLLAQLQDPLVHLLLVAFRNLFVNRWLWGAVGLQVAVVHFSPPNLLSALRR